MYYKGLDVRWGDDDKQYSFQEVMKQWARRCAACDRNERVHCTVDGMTCSLVKQFPKNADWNKYEKELMQWAAEHPAPTNPTFGAWLKEIGILKGNKATGFSIDYDAPIPDAVWNAIALIQRSDK